MRVYSGVPRVNSGSLGFARSFGFAWVYTARIRVAELFSGLLGFNHHALGLQGSLGFV